MEYLEAIIRDQNRALALAAETIEALREENVELKALARDIVTDDLTREIASLFMEAKAGG